MAPTQPSRTHSQKDLPPSVESAYYRKCIDLRRRISNISESNDSTRQRILRLNRGVQKMRLERAFLLEQLNKHMEYNIDDSDRSTSPPPTPTDKPLRSKRANKGGEVRGSSVVSTPDAQRIGNSYFPGASPGVNGISLPALQPSRAEGIRGQFFDPAYDEERTVEAKVDVEEGGRQRSYSGAGAGAGVQHPLQATAVQNGDTEMGDAGFTSVNR